MAVVMSATSILQSLTDVGARESLIQNPRGSEDRYAEAAWWMGIGRASSLCPVVVFAPTIARFYGNQELSVLLRVAATGLVLEGAISTRAYVAIREMKFKKWAFVSNGGGILGVFITVVLSFYIRDVWALVIGYVAENAARAIFSFALCPMVPRFPPQKEALHDLLRFSKGLLGLSLLNLIFIRTDVFALAKLYSPGALGVYAMAIYLAQTPSSFVINLLNQTLLPTFSHLRDDSDRMNRILLRSTSVTLMLGAPIVAASYFSGSPALSMIYGRQYASGALAFFFAACVALLNVANSQITMVFYAKGTPSLHRRCVAVMAAVMLVLIYPAARTFGLVGGQIACAVAILSGYGIQIERILHLTGLNLEAYAKVFIRPLLAGTGVAAICVVAKYLDSSTKPLHAVVSAGIGCAFAYGLTALHFFRQRREIA